MNEPGFHHFQFAQRRRHRHLNPSAQEFFPSLPLLPPHIYYPYPPHHSPFYPTPFCPPAYVITHPLIPAPVPLSLPPPCKAPSRALVLSLVPADVSESMLRRELELFGDVRAVQMERLRLDGIVTVHFYDLRHARAALVEIQEQHMQHQFRLKMYYDAVWVNNHTYNNNLLPPPLPPPARGLIFCQPVWVQFTPPPVHSLPDGYNQGTLVISNLDPSVSSSNLQQMFEGFGAVRELRDTPMKTSERFVEYYDTRDAAKALAEMNGKEINGKCIRIEFDRPGSGDGHGKRFSPKSPQLSPPQPPHSQSTTVAKEPVLAKNPSGGDSGSSQDSMASLCINGKGDEGSFKTEPSTIISKKGDNSSGDTSKQQHNQAKSSGQLKGSRQVKQCNPRFLINEDAIMESNCKDSRTTLMIKNIPNKYSLKLLLNLLDNHCIRCNHHAAGGDNQPLSSYDFVYLPIDFINKCNVGYGFVNMTSPEATWKLYKAFHLQSWRVFNSRKICEVTYARVQGVEALREHFKNSKFPCSEEEYMPVVFSPPRDGRQLTKPVPIVSRVSNCRPPLLRPSSSYAVGSFQDQSHASSSTTAIATPRDNCGGGDDDEEVNEVAEHNIGGGVGCGRSSSNGGDSGDNHE